MLATIFNWLVVIWLCFLVGARLEDNLWKAKPESPGIWHLPITLLNGLACWAFLANVLSLVSALNWETLIYIAGVGLLETVMHMQFYIEAFKKRTFSFSGNSRPLLIFFFFALAVFFLKSISPTEVFDEGAYYRPFLLVVEKYGVIPGLGNLNLHSALNSSWHVVQALFGMKGFWFFNGVYDLNGWLSVVLLCLSVGSGSYLLNSRTIEWNQLPYFILTALPAFIYRNLLTGPSTDIPAIIISWLIWVFFLIVAFEPNSSKSKYLSFTIIWFGLFVFTIKITSVMLLLPGLFLLLWWLPQKKYQWTFVWVLIAISVLIPHFFRNYLLSGYLFYPLTQIDIFNPDWKIPLDRVEGKFYLAQFRQFSPPEQYNLFWFKSWFPAFNLESRIIISLSFISLVVAPLFLIRFKNILGIRFRAIYFSMLCASIVWLFSVTEPRYGFGTLLVLALMFIGMLIIIANKMWLKIGFLILVAGLQFFHFIKTIRDLNFSDIRFVEESASPKVVKEKINCGNFTAYTPVKYHTLVPSGKPVFCWGIKFPCLPKEDQNEAYRVMMRTNRIKDGFKSQPSQFKQ